MALQELGRSMAYTGEYIGVENINLEGGKSWENVARVGNNKAVAGLLRHKENQSYILIEQYRYPVAQKVLELVAGLQDKHGLSPEEHLAQEVVEETGYSQIDSIHLVGEVSGSAGLTSETALLYNVEVSGERGEQQLEESEDISVIEVAIKDVKQFIKDRLSRGMLVDPKLCMAIYMSEDL